MSSPINNASLETSLTIDEAIKQAKEATTYNQKVDQVLEKYLKESREDSTIPISSKRATLLNIAEINESHYDGIVEKSLDQLIQCLEDDPISEKSAIGLNKFVENLSEFLTTDRIQHHTPTFQLKLAKINYLAIEIVLRHQEAKDTVRHISAISSQLKKKLIDIYEQFENIVTIIVSGRNKDKREIDPELEYLVKATKQAIRFLGDDTTTLQVILNTTINVIKALSDLKNENFSQFFEGSYDIYKDLSTRIHESWYREFFNLKCLEHEVIYHKNLACLGIIEHSIWECCNSGNNEFSKKNIRFITGTILMLKRIAKKTTEIEIRQAAVLGYRHVKTNEKEAFYGLWQIFEDTRFNSSIQKLACDAIDFLWNFEIIKSNVFKEKTLCDFIGKNKTYRLKLLSFRTKDKKKERESNQKPLPGQSRSISISTNISGRNSPSESKINQSPLSNTPPLSPRPLLSFSTKDENKEKESAQKPLPGQSRSISISTNSSDRDSPSESMINQGPLSNTPPAIPPRPQRSPRFLNINTPPPSSPSLFSFPLPQTNAFEKSIQIIQSSSTGSDSPSESLSSSSPPPIPPLPPQTSPRLLYNNTPPPPIPPSISLSPKHSHSPILNMPKALPNNQSNSFSILSTPDSPISRATSNSVPTQSPVPSLPPQISTNNNTLPPSSPSSISLLPSQDFISNSARPSITIPPPVQKPLTTRRPSTQTHQPQHPNPQEHLRNNSDPEVTPFRYSMLSASDISERRSNLRKREEKSKENPPLSTVTNHHQINGHTPDSPKRPPSPHRSPPSLPPFLTHSGAIVDELKK